MEHSACKSFTVVDPSLPFLNQCFLVLHTRKLVWNAASPHDRLRKKGHCKVKLYRWVGRVADVACSHAIDASDIIVKPSAAVSGLIETHLVGTASLVSWIVAQPAINQSTFGVKRETHSWLEAICEKAMLAHKRISLDDIAFNVGPTNIVVLRSGGVDGWEALLRGCCDKVRAEWATFASRGHGVAILVNFAVIHSVSPHSSNYCRNMYFWG